MALRASRHMESPQTRDRTCVSCIGRWILHHWATSSESEVAQWCPTLCDPVDCSLPDSSVHGIFQARVMEWVAISFSRTTREPLNLSSLVINLVVRGGISKESLVRVYVTFICDKWNLILILSAQWHSTGNAFPLGRSSQGFCRSCVLVVAPFQCGHCSLLFRTITEYLLTHPGSILWTFSLHLPWND